ncbi:MAG: hypothetical protein KDD69_09875, partial [Bdellovibrionales bacterium]|nr:hypothetical protein [Bdellovibrionales bacterium]
MKNSHPSPSEAATPDLEIWPGSAAPLGATPGRAGVNFALYSEHAEKVELCIFDTAEARQETRRYQLPERTNNVWHGFLPGAKPGLIYAYRVYGPYEPLHGHRFNPNKLVLDPYVRRVVREARVSQTLFSYSQGTGADLDLTFDRSDSAADSPLGMVVADDFDWGNDARPDVPWHRTVLYEAHVKGLTMRHPDVPPELRGTYAAVASKPILQHLIALGVTSIELLPVHQHAPEGHLHGLGLSNYWGYNTLAFFAPDLRFASGKFYQSPLDEFKYMVRTLHAAGIEVILDVVYNHTAEGNHLGPTLSFRGIDNAAYYRLEPENKRYYRDYTGCGNTLDTRNPRVLQLIMDSLRYWVEEM